MHIISRAKREEAGTKKQRPSRRGVARALEPLEGGKGLIGIFIHDPPFCCKKKIPPPPCHSHPAASG